jgi:hypothetical protein
LVLEEPEVLSDWVVSSTVVSSSTISDVVPSAKGNTLVANELR